ncbi:CUB domain-containing protein [Flavobacterium sp.]|uniref:CUB domain-containing protein n=1 Tax=Flavobacterium sp. TaxID=239 RepID=UPI0037513DF5
MGTSSSWKIRCYPLGGLISSWSTVSSTTYSILGLVPNTYYIVEITSSCSGGLVNTVNKTVFITATDFCDGIVFTDSGKENGSYINRETVVRTIVPSVANNTIILNFSAFSLEQDKDFLYVYDGNSTSSPLLNFGGSTGTVIPGPFTSSAVDGSLTVKFFSDRKNVAPGFIANISCMSNLSVTDFNGFIDFSYFPNLLVVW